MQVVARKAGRRLTESLSAETRSRLAAAALWSLVALAAAGGLYAAFRPAAPAGEAGAEGPDTVALMSSGWAASGFAERYVAAYLVAPDGAALRQYLGYEPELRARPDLEDADAAAPPVVRAVAVESVGPDYWAVTVATAGDELWRVGVLAGDGLVATGLPAPVAAPAVDSERVDLAVSLLETPPVDDPMVDTMAGFLGAYVCGQGDLARFLRPGLDMAAVSPPVCDELELSRWGTVPGGDGTTETVLVEAVLDPDEAPRTVTYAAELARRDGRWEIAELESAPPLAGTH